VTHAYTLCKNSYHFNGKADYNEIKYTSALSILFIHKAKCFDQSVGHLQAHIAD